MPLFDIIGGEPTINPEVLFVPGFREIWASDKTKDKIEATQKILYVYHLCNPRSAYSLMPISERAEEVEKDFLKPFGLTVDSLIDNAVKKYSEVFLRDAGVRFLEGIEVAVDQITLMLKDPKTYQPGSKIKFSDIKDFVVKGNDLLSSYYKLRKQIEEGIQDDVKYRGGAEPGLVEEFINNA